MCMGRSKKVEALLAIMTLSKFAFSDVTAFPTLPFWSIEYIYTAYWQSASQVPALISVCLPDSLCAYCVWYITYRVCMVHLSWYIAYHVWYITCSTCKLHNHATIHATPILHTTQVCHSLYYIANTTVHHIVNTLRSIILLLHITYT